MESAEAAVRNIIARVSAVRFDPRLERVVGTYRFDVERVGSFLMRVDRGRIEMRESGTAADCVVQCDPEEFVRVASGEQNLLTAYMQGLVAIRGNPALAQKLHGILPAPRSNSRTEDRS